MPRPTIVHLVNRSTVPLDFMDDGIPYVALPGYKLEAVVDDEGQPVLTEARDANGKIISEQELPGRKKSPRMVPKLVAIPIGKDGETVDKDGKTITEPYAMAIQEWAAIRGVRAHPVMGTQDPFVSTRFLPYMAIPEYEMDTSFIPRQDDKIERIDRSMLPADRQNISIISAFGGRKTKPGPRKGDKAERRDIPSELINMRGAFTIENMTCPTGFRMSYEDV